MGQFFSEALFSDSARAAEWSHVYNCKCSKHFQNHIECVFWRGGYMEHSAVMIALPWPTPDGSSLGMNIVMFSSSMRVACLWCVLKHGDTPSRLTSTRRLHMIPIDIAPGAPISRAVR
eukprot:3914313-Pyramimonas_sp.AAC.2